MNNQKPLIACVAYRVTLRINDQLGIALSAAYTQAIINAGGIPLMIPLGLDPNAWVQIFDTVDGIMLPGGGDVSPASYDRPVETKLRGMDVDRDMFEIWLIHAAIAQKKPLLGICRGHQVINVALGGTLWQDVPSELPSDVHHDTQGIPARSHISHTATVDPDSRLGRSLQERVVNVNSIHHQAIRELGEGLVVTAVSPDNLIEGIELPDHPFAVGVQWHPEWLVQNDPIHRRLFASFVQAAAQ